MKVHYYKDTDSLLYRHQREKSADSREVAPGVVLDFDTKRASRKGIDIDHASRNADISNLEAIALPLRHTPAAREPAAKYSTKKKVVHKR